MPKWLLLAVLMFSGSALASPALSPMTLQLTGPRSPKAGQTLDLQLRLELHVAMNVPTELQLQLPGGAKLVEGALLDTIPAQTTGVIVRKYRVRIARVPNVDILATADIRTTGGGAHATANYAFGRAQPTVTRPQAPSSKPGPFGGAIPVK